MTRSSRAEIPEFTLPLTLHLSDGSPNLCGTMNPSILIIDDDTSVITSLALLLKQAGYRSHFATSPSQALEALKGNGIELVLQDMNFSRQTSGEEGLSLLRQIKSVSPHIPVILMTAWGSISLAVEG